MPFLHFLLVSLWAILAAIAVGVFALGFGSTSTSTRAPPDFLLLAPGASAWTPLGHEDDGQSLVDAVVLPDGRLAATAIVTFDATKARPCDIYDPRSKQWSRGVEVIPPHQRLATSAAPEAKLWTNVGDGSALVLRASGDSCAATLEPGNVALPPLARCPEQFSAARTNDGALVVVAAFGAEAKTLRLDRGASAFSELAPPPLPVAPEALQPFGPSGVVMNGPTAYAVLEDGRWRTLPPLQPARYASTLVRMPDGAVVAAGGMLQQERRVVEPAALAVKVAAGVALLVLAVLAWRALSSPARPQLAAILAGLAVGWGAFPAFAFWVLKSLAWH